MENVMNQEKLEGYSSAVRAVSWDPSGSILVSLAMASRYGVVLTIISDDMYPGWQDCDMGYDPVTTKEGEGIGRNHSRRKGRIVSSVLRCLTQFLTDHDLERPNSHTTAP